jgi:hypothetical protein
MLPISSRQNSELVKPFCAAKSLANSLFELRERRLSVFTGLLQDIA